MRPPGFSRGIKLIPRIEPGTLTWEASILPLYYERIIDRKSSYFGLY